MEPRRTQGKHEEEQGDATSPDENEAGRVPRKEKRNENKEGSEGGRERRNK